MRGSRTGLRRQLVGGRSGRPVGAVRAIGYLILVSISVDATGLATGHTDRLTAAHVRVAIPTRSRCDCSHVRGLANALPPGGHTSCGDHHNGEARQVRVRRLLPRCSKVIADCRKHERRGTNGAGRRLSPADERKHRLGRSSRIRSLMMIRGGVAKSNTPRGSGPVRPRLDGDVRGRDCASRDRGAVSVQIT